MENPVLSFCIPTYNRAQRVYKCVNHILQYPGDDIEVVVSNNASTDDTLAVLSTIKDPRLSVYSNDENIYGKNWSLVAALAKGVFNAILSDEDVVLLENLHKIIKFLKENPNLGNIYYHLKGINFIKERYISQSRMDGMALAVRHGGHITCVIMNTEKYKRYALSFINEANKFRYDYVTLVAPMMIANEGELIALIPESLCDLGSVVPPSDEIIREHIDSGNFFGLSPSVITGVFFRLVDSSIAMDLNIKESHTLTGEFFCRFFIIGVFFVNALFNDNIYNQMRGLDAIRAHVRQNGMDPIVEINRAFDGFFNCIKEKIIHWDVESLRNVVYSVINKRIDDYLPERLTSDEIIWLGNITFKYLRVVASTLEGYDVFELKETDEMWTMLKDGNYKAVTEYKELRTCRSNFLKGQAHMLQSDYGSAETHLMAFLSVAENPRTIADIPTGILSRQLSYYYLGVICQKTTRYLDSLAWFSKCKKITDDHCLGELMTRNNMNVCLK